MSLLPPVFAAALDPHPIMIVPFVVMLLAIALMPLLNLELWDRHIPKVAIGLAAITTCYYVFVLGNPGRMLHQGYEYASFIALVGSLSVVSGGIYIDVKGEAKPWSNCLFLLIGAIVANLIGTTGTSMLLIRPWIRMNKYRITAFHIVFFIFLVSNVGGSLTPVGDPPLFLGYLKGIPFWWVVQKCWVAWVITVGALLGIFFVLDRRNFLRAPAEIRAAETREEIWKIEGRRNIVFLTIILVAVFLRSPPGLRESLMVVAAIGSWFATPARVRQANAFTFHPIREVAWLFFGIFATMVPAVDYVQSHAGRFGLSDAMEFYWFTGLVSSVLDNAPTYLTCLAAAMGRYHLNIDEPGKVLEYVASHDHELMAISVAAVFFGAMTYIGNGPNFLVRAIAQQAKVQTPGFFDYAIKYALPILLPLLGLISLLFFSRWRIF